MNQLYPLGKPGEEGAFLLLQLGMETRKQHALDMELEPMPIDAGHAQSRPVLLLEA
jgi:hypothetical protein